MKKTIVYSLTCLLISLSLITRAQSHAAHVHGLATLTLALENQVLEIQFESPAANLLGFEHKARTLEEKKIVKQIEALLRLPSKLFSFIGSNCKPKKTMLDMSGVMAVENEKNNGHDKHEHHNHSAKHSNESHNHEDHSEIIANYRFNCVKANDLNSISTTLFDHFPNIEKINAMWVTDSGQGSELITAKRNTISLK